MDFRSLLLLPVVCYAVVATAAPNLIVIMADDLGYADVGFNGCKDIPTPNIDSIASHGVRCTNGYVSYSVCGPSRAGFMTGRYQQRFGFERNPQYKPNDPDMGLTRKEKTIAELLAPVGYHSGIIGKWHLGAHAPTSHPMKRGFNEFYGHLGGGHKYMPEDLVIKDSAKARGEAESYRTWILKNHTPVSPRKYLTDEFSDEAVSFVERNKAQPFFLFLSYNAPHTPLQATTKYLDRFSHIKDPKRKTYAAMVSAIDDGVGFLLETLRENKLEEKTIVAFLSDNGGPITKNASLNTPLRGAKGDVWEGGLRVPFALQWKGTLPAGKTYDHPVSSLDFAATMAALSGAKVDKAKPLDGVNIIPYLTGKNPNPPHEVLYLRKFDDKRFSVRKGKYKLAIPFRNGKPQLYDLDEDVGETRDLASAKPKILSELDVLLKEWSAQLIEPTFMGLIHLPSRNKKKNKK